MSKSELHDWECEIEELSGNNADKILNIARDIYKTAFVRGRNSMTWEQEPTTKNDLAVDCIDRAQAQTEIELNASRYTLAKERGSMGKIEWGGLLIKVGEAVDIIRSLPPVTPTRKKGHWIITNDYLTAAYETIDYVKCSCCGEESLEEGDYCPNCGSFMKGEFE